MFCLEFQSSAMVVDGDEKRCLGEHFFLVFSLHCFEGCVSRTRWRSSDPVSSNHHALIISRNILTSSSITTIKSDVCLRQLAGRVTINKITFFHRIYYSPEQEIYIKTPDFISRRHDHTRKVKPIYARTNKY